MPRLLRGTALDNTDGEDAMTSAGGAVAGPKGGMSTVGIVVMSLDGCLTRHQEEGVGFASEADRAYFDEVLDTFDCTLFGAGAFEARRAAILGTLSRRRMRVVWTRTPSRYRDLERAEMLEFRSGSVEGILADLADRGRRRCAILGGAALLTTCLRSGLMPELWVTIEPVVFGSGRRMFEGCLHTSFRLQGLRRLSEDTLLLEYRLRGEAGQ
jgi:dihydrofolate reductase